MAFWALGKVKNITGKLNIKEVGSKLKGYVATNAQQNEKQKTEETDYYLSEQEQMHLQLQQYKKLTELQQEIMGEEEKKVEKEYREEEERLKESLLMARVQAEELQRASQKRRMIEEVECGKKQIKAIIKQNIEMREKIEQIRANS